MIKYLLIFLYVPLVYAIDPNAVIENEMMTRRVDCHFEGNETQKKAKACAIEICGPISEIPPSKLSREFFDDYNFDRAEGRYRLIEKKLSEIVLIEEKEKEELKLELEKRITNGLNLKPEEAGQFIVALFEKDLSIEQNLDSSEIQINYHGPDSISIAKKKELENLKIWLGEKLKTSTELRLAFGVRTTIEEKKKYLEDLMYEVDSALINIPKILPEEAKYLNNIKNSISYYKSGGVIPRFGYETLIKQIRQVKLLMENKYRAPVSVRTKYQCTGNCLNLFKSNTFKKIFLKESTLNVKLTEKELQNRVKSCGSLFYIDEYNNDLVSPKNLDAVISDINYAKDSFVRFIEEEFSEETSKDFNQRFSNIASVIIGGRSIMGNSMSQSSVQMESFVHNYESIPLTKQNDFDLLDRAINGSQLDQFINEKCLGFDEGINFSEDYYIPMLDELGISNFTLSNERRGRSLIIAQLGNILSAMALRGNISKKSESELLRKRSCISNRHLIKNYVGFDRVRFEGDHSETQVNFSDYLADQTLKSSAELGTISASLACPLLASNGADLKDFNLDFDLGSNKSSLVLRLINSLLNKEIDIPSSCSDYMSEVSHLYTPTKCE